MIKVIHIICYEIKAVDQKARFIQMFSEKYRIISKLDFKQVK